MDPTPANAKPENIAKIEANAIAFNFTMFPLSPTFDSTASTETVLIGSSRRLIRQA
jgi:hypothetical protein